MPAQNTSPLSMRILIVDDDRLMRMVLQVQIEELGHHVITATNGALAWDYLQQNNAVDIIVIDREMPHMSGMEVVHRIKKDPKLKNIPIIMLTGSDKTKQIREGIDAGVYYYLTKPIEHDILASVITSAAREVAHQIHLSDSSRFCQQAFTLVESCRFFIRTLEQAEATSCFLANCYPNPERVAMGISALIINAIEHGNLKIGYQRKTELIKNNRWAEEVLQRSQLPENQNKKVEITLKRRQDLLQLKITDMGDGFAWRDYLKIDPARAQDNHGRGIAQANTHSFDSIIFNETGNEVTAFSKINEV